MSQEQSDDSAWFRDIDPHDVDAAATAITNGTAEHPQNWPTQAVASGAVEDATAYYQLLHDAAITATQTAIESYEASDDRQLRQCLTAMDDVERTANELTERLIEWGGSRVTSSHTLDKVRELADITPSTPAETRLRSLATRVLMLHEERDDLRAYIETQAATVAPNLASMAGPVLATRLIELAGGLNSLARKPAGTIQVLGAEDALFAHLEGRASAPKHGVIFTHEYVRGTRPADRGSAARAFAGKLAIAARIDHYSGTHKQSVHDELTDRIETIRARETEDTDTI